MPTDSTPTKRKSRSISSFLKKTYEILQNPQNNHIVRWSQSGIGFVVIKQEQFSKEILPRYFKHSNYSSFVRQLNMYNFHKIREANYESHFHHEFFKKNNKALLAEIRRKPEKKKRKNQEYSEDEQEEDNDHYNDKSDHSMKYRIKQYNNSNSNFNSGEIKIKSYRSTDKKNFEPTRHAFVSEKENQYENIPSIVEHNKNDGTFQQDANESKQRVSIQNILSNPNQNDDDKLSINNQLGENFPRYPTRQIFYPSSNNIYPFPINFKGGNTISQFNILF